MDLSSPLGMALRSPLGAHAAEGVTPSALRLALQMFGDSMPKEARGFVRWGTPGSAGGGGAASGRVHEWWPPSATAAASGWTPVAMHRGAPPHGRATPPFLRDRLTADDALDADENSALARWGGVSSASTQVFRSSDGGSEFERMQLSGCAHPLPAEELDERCVSAALALALARSAPPSPLVLSPLPRGGRAKGAPPAAKKAAAGRGRAAAGPWRAAPKPKAAVLSLPQAAAPPLACSSKRKRAAPAAEASADVASALDDSLEEAPAEAAETSSKSGRGMPGVCGWTAEEDKALLTLINTYGEHDWVGLSKALGCGRTGKQARERYMYIKPGLNRGPWSEEEESALMAHQARMGNRWAEISRLMSRGENTVKNHFYSRQKAALKAAGGALVAMLPAMMVEEGSGAVM